MSTLTSLTLAEELLLVALDDERGTLLERFTLDGKAPLLKAGENQVRFACAAPSDGTARAEITLIAAGAPLRGRTPAKGVNWALLRDSTRCRAWSPVAMARRIAGR